MSATVHQLTPRRDPIRDRAEALTDPTAIALNAIGRMAMAATWLAKHGYRIAGTATGAGRVHLGNGHLLRRHERGPSILVQPRPGIYRDLSGAEVGQYQGGDGRPVLVMRGTAPGHPDVAIYWTSEGEPQCA